MIAASASVVTGPDTKPLKIDIVVHGRFHAFHLAKALISHGHDVRILTNYPRWAASRFGIPPSRIVSFALHGVVSRIHDRTFAKLLSDIGIGALHRAFGAWAARTVRDDCDLVHIFSGVAEETLLRFQGRAWPKVWLVRGSAHIRKQRELLLDEERRAGLRIDKPGLWITSREEREYTLSSGIVTLSTFTHKTFSEYSDLIAKCRLLLAAVDTMRFQPTFDMIAERQSRIRRGDKLRILTVGAFSFRKGAIDIAATARSMQGRATFRFVGDLLSETETLRRKCAGLIEFCPRVSEFDLLRQYAWGDIFLFPTIEDGFPAVIAQAQASGLPVITTPNGSGPDLINEGKNGWIVPIRSSQDICTALNKADADRIGLAAVVDACVRDRIVRDWNDMALDLVSQFRDAYGVRLVASTKDVTHLVSRQ